MLSIPVFTLIVSGLYLFSGPQTLARGVLAPIPMFILVLDFGSWWLAREIEAFIYVVAASGAIFGFTFGLQLLVTTISLWRPAETPSTAG